MVEVVENLGRGVLFQDVLVDVDQEAAGAGGRSPTRSPGLGSIIRTIMRMMWRGVRNWPLRPAVLSLLRRYS